MTLQIAPKVERSVQIELRELTGSLLVRTKPAGAFVTVDHEPRGRSPIRIDDLPVRREHVVSAALEGYRTREMMVRVDAGTTKEDSIVLLPIVSEVHVSTSPQNCRIVLDGVEMGTSPLVIEALSAGRHRIQAEAFGYSPLDSSVVVAEGNHAVYLELTKAPPGYLVIQGSRPATMFVNERLVRQNVHHSGEMEVPPGVYVIKVLLVSGEEIVEEIAVSSAQYSTFDFTAGVVRREPLVASE